MTNDPNQWWPQVGETLAGRFLIRREVGRGLHGIVFMAEQNSDQRLYRLKLIHPEFFRAGDESEENLFRVQRVLAYRDAAILKISDVLELGSTYALLSPWETGTTLSDDIKERSRLGKVLAPMEVLPIFTDVVTGLRWIHKFGAHGNLRPENLLLGSDGTLLLDPFRLRISTTLDHRTDYADFAKQTERFLAPEQISNPEADDPRSDVYALGILLGQALTGFLVRSGLSLKEQGGGHVTDDIDELFAQATNSKLEERISLDEFFRLVGELLTEASEKRVGFERSENITLVTGLPAMTDELLEAVEEDKKERKRAEAEKAAREAKEGFGLPSLVDNVGLASEGTILQGAQLPNDQKEIIEEALEESLKRGGSARIMRDAVPDFNPTLAGAEPKGEAAIDGGPDEATLKEARRTAQEDVVASVRGSVGSDEELTVDLEEILEEMDSIVPPPSEPVALSEIEKKSDGPDPTIEIGVDFDFEEIPTDATPAPEEIEIEVIAEADLLLEGMDEEVSELDVQEPPPHETIDDTDAIELRASDLEVEEITQEVADEIAHQLHVETIGDATDEQRPYGGVDTDRIGVPAGGFKDPDRRGARVTWSPVVVGLILISFIALVFVKVIVDEQGKSSRSSRDMNSSDVLVPGGVTITTGTDSRGTDEPAHEADVRPARIDTLPSAAPDSSVAVAATDQKAALDPVTPDQGKKTAETRPPVEDVSRTVTPVPTPVPTPDTTPDTTTDTTTATPPVPAVVTPSEVVVIGPVTSCPAGFVRVPGKEEVSPFCIQTHEYPGVGKKPKVRVTLAESQDLCGEVGARLCRKEEFPLACDARFPYGKRFRRSNCNVAGEFFDARSVRKSGSKKKCVSALGVYDLSGNVAEWLEGGYAGGGSSSETGASVSCTKSPKKNPKRRYSKVGFRCCLSLQP